LPKIQRTFAILAISLFAAASVSGQAAHSFPFRATNYDVEVFLHPEDQTIQGQAKVDFVADQVAKTVLVELHQDLHVTAVKMNGQPLTYARDNNAPLLLTVALPGTVSPGTRVTLAFEYSGPVSSEEDSPTRGVRFASVEKTNAYLLLPARWFPLTNYPSNRYTGKFNLIVPSGFTVAGTGKSDPPATQPGIGLGSPTQASYVFHCDQPAPNGSFVAGSLQMTAAPTEGYQFSFYTPASQVPTVSSYAASLAQIMGYFADTFGTLNGPQGPIPSLAIAQLPDGTLGGYSAPGVLMISAREWTPKSNDRLLSQLAAGQWWGDRVLPATAGDVWVTDGMSRYAEAMYAEQSGGVGQLNKALEDYAVGALMFEDAAPISQADHIGAYSDPYYSIVYDKGAMVFHMLRAELGDEAFTNLLKEFYRQHAGKTATIDSFEKMTKAPPMKPGEPPVNLLSFYSQWLNSTGVPEFTLQYIVYRTPKGFQINGTVKQPLDTFRMPVQVKVDTEGNPETKTILVTGTSSQFKVETFGRPKPNGITIDPNNNLLKSSPRLRVRATISRGEALATLGKYYEAIQEYQRALDVQPTNSLAHFRMAEAMFYQKNYQAAANAFRAALGGDLDPKWTEVWAHVYMGKIYDILGQRERAVNEYNRAQHLKDDTAGAQAEAARYIKTPYNPDATSQAQSNQNNAAQPTVTASGNAAQVPAAAAQAADPANKEPTLKKRTESN